MLIAHSALDRLCHAKKTVFCDQQSSLRGSDTHVLHSNKQLSVLPPVYELTRA